MFVSPINWELQADMGNWITKNVQTQNSSCQNLGEISHDFIAPKFASAAEKMGETGGAGVRACGGVVHQQAIHRKEMATTCHY